jgi:hypothetical protein
MYKLCINCDTENTADAVFCTECGMTLTRAPTGESDMKIREELKEAAPLFTIPMVRYATEAKANSVTKLLERDDEGSLEMTKDSITFRGSKFTVRIDTESIVGLDLTTQKPALVPLIVANAIAGLVYLLDRSAVTPLPASPSPTGSGCW